MVLPGGAPAGARRHRAEVLSAAGVSVARGKRVVLREVDLTVRGRPGVRGDGPQRRREVDAAVDAPGHPASDDRPGRGRGCDPAGLDPAARRSRIGLVPQDADDLLYLETVDEECAAADAGAGAGAGTCRAVLDWLVPGIPGDRHPRDLSQGQRLALVLAIVLAAAPALVLLDEPTRGLDYTAKRALAPR